MDWRKTGLPIEKEREEIQSYKAEIARLKSSLEKKEDALTSIGTRLSVLPMRKVPRILREAEETHF